MPKPLKRSNPFQLPDQLCWRTVKVPPGAHGPYMVAGPGWQGQVHHTGKGGRTVACAAHMTDGELLCVHCKHALRFGCYLPLFAMNGGKQIQIVVQGAKRSWETWSGFKFGDMVNVLRGKAERDTILFTARAVSAPTLSISNMRSRGEQDIDAYLLHLWQLEALCKWHEHEWHPSSRTLDSDRAEWILADGSAKPTYATAV